MSGVKRWQIYSNNFDKPTEAFRYGRRPFDVGEPTESIDLEPGQMLYLPRGVPHAATALQESLHITFGIEEPTISDLLRSIANLSEVEPALRTNIDCNLARSDPEYLAGILNTIRKEFSHRLESSKTESAFKNLILENLDRSPRRDASFLNGL